MSANRSKTAAVGVALLLGLLVGISGISESRAPLIAAASPRFKAIAFDYFVVFNPDSVVAQVERILPGKSREFTNVWRSRQFEYTWLRSITGRYVDFSAVTMDALVYAAQAMDVTLTADDQQRLLSAYLHLDPWPDSADALLRLHDSGMRIITIADFSPSMLRTNADNAGLTPMFDALVSTDANHTYKPDPRAYRLGMDRLHLEKQEIVFAAFGGWDAAGAKSFGYPTVWVNRFSQPVEELGVRADQTCANLDCLIEFVLDNKRAAMW